MNKFLSMARGAAGVCSGVLLAVLLVAGCNEESSYQLSFNHKMHVEDFELSCADCHGDVSGGRFQAPSHDSCIDCHEDWIKAEVEEDTCGNCHKVEDLVGWAARPPAEPEQVVAGVFVHTEALAGSCLDCHGQLFGDDVDRVKPLSRDEVIALRDRAHRSGMECSACHVGMDPDIPPPSHDLNWERTHGEWGLRSDNACSVCHTEQSCRECHQESMPVSHNNLWRLKTHGIEAAWSRDRCEVCHEQDSCNACHAEVQPVSHRAGWIQSHCDQCHLDSAAGTGCAMCHESSLGDHPNPHRPNYRSTHCDSCHVESQQMDCGACHDFSGLRDHPNPHSAGFRYTHCNSCHEGSSSQQECGACHEGAGSVCLHEDFWPPVHDRFGCEVSCGECHW